MKNFYVYQVKHKLSGVKYIGSSSCECNPDNDIGVKYFTSSCYTPFKEDFKINRSHYNVKILKVFKTRLEAIQLETHLHRKYDVANSTDYYNIVIQPKTEYDPTKYKPTDKHRLHMKRVMTGKHHSAETIQKMCASQKGRTFTAEHREKIRQTLLGTKQSKETIAKRKKSNSNPDDATRERMSKASKASWAKRKAMQATV